MPSPAGFSRYPQRGISKSQPIVSKRRKPSSQLTLSKGKSLSKRVKTVLTTEASNVQSTSAISPNTTTDVPAVDGVDLTTNSPSFLTVPQNSAQTPIDFLISIDRKLSCLIGIMSEFKNIITKNTLPGPNMNDTIRTEPSKNTVYPGTDPTAAEPESSMLIDIDSQTVRFKNSDKERFENLLEKRGDLCYKILRNTTIADIYSENLGMGDPLIPKKCLEFISRTDKDSVISFKQKISVQNTEREIERMRLFAQNERETLESVDSDISDCIQAFPNEHLSKVSEERNRKNEQALIKLWQKKARFFKDENHTRPLSFLKKLQSNLQSHPRIQKSENPSRQHTSNAQITPREGRDFIPRNNINYPAQPPHVSLSYADVVKIPTNTPQRGFIPHNQYSTEPFVPDIYSSNGPYSHGRTDTNMPRRSFGAYKDHNYTYSPELSNTEMPANFSSTCIPPHDSYSNEVFRPYPTAINNNYHNSTNNVPPLFSRSERTQLNFNERSYFLEKGPRDPGPRY